MWEAQTALDAAARVQSVALRSEGRPLSYADVLRLWQRDASFRDWFVSLLEAVPFEAYFWETPPVTRATADRPFEFVLVESRELARVAPERAAFASHFAAAAPDQPALVFPNLGGDAQLVVPSPQGPIAAYAHLAAFVRGAPRAQAQAFWQTVGAEMEQRLCDRAIWLSTAGLGVSWLHLRLDSRPKYYRHRPYLKLA